ncbi:uncharacterized protein LOC113868471 isoform X2 [Abrus precatorius]|uniref:Uncharacterized protein LOC113868471 isoform X2 n=1 Tax=Abrus precatorius TaxID=3816 RepID=A0A8B8LY93_ABRPR|nr:uncharacterized protein LOC113868471 isoform X2 [Abrus precatorius]
MSSIKCQCSWLLSNSSPVMAANDKINDARHTNFAQIPSWISLKHSHSSLRTHQNKQGQVENLHLISLAKQGKLREVHDFIKTMDEAEKFFDEMVNRDLFSWATIISAYTEEWRIDEAVRLLVRMLDLGWNMLFYLWGIFRGRRIIHSDSAKKTCIPSLSALPVEVNSSAVVTSPETLCSPKCMHEESIDCDKACNAVLPSTSIDQHQIAASRNIDVNHQTHLHSQENLGKLDGSIDSKSTSRVPRNSSLLCQEMKSAGSSLKAGELEHGKYRVSKPSDAMGTSVRSRIVEAKTDSDITGKQENGLYSLIPFEKVAASIDRKEIFLHGIKGDEDEQSSKRKQKEDFHNVDLEANIDNNQETDAASNFRKDRGSKSMISNVEDQQRPKRKQKDERYIDLEANIENQETCGATYISMDKSSEKIDSDEDQRLLKRKQKDNDHHYINLEAAFQDELCEGNCQLPNDREVQNVDFSDTIMGPSVVSCQKMPWNEGNGKLEDGESSSKKLKTGFSRIYESCSSRGGSSFSDSFTSLRNDLGSSSSVKDKGCEEACDEKIIHEDLGTMERTFFPVDTHNISDAQSVLNSMSMKGLRESEEQFQDVIPNLELALGGKTKPLLATPPPAPKGMLPFLVGAVDRKNNHPNGLGDGQEDDAVAASLSLSLSFPSSNKEHKKAASKAELLPEGHPVNTSLLLFGRFPDK